jgi:carboxypeptidase C (cathepsin A)
MYYSLWSAYGHPPTTADARVPLILWLQGGPGASSQFGAFTENGPIRITKDKIKEDSHAWNIMGHTVFIDQPLGVGFSRGKPHHRTVESARQAADHLLNFLHNLYIQWPALKASPLYITGESFAGHYIPAFALKINKNMTFLPNKERVNFGGIAIGDGWTDPYNQVNQYDSYLYSVGVVSNKFRDYATWFQTQAIHHMAMGDARNVPRS